MSGERLTAGDGNFNWMVFNGVWVDVTKFTCDLASRNRGSPMTGGDAIFGDTRILSKLMRIGDTFASAIG